MSRRLRRDAGSSDALGLALLTPAAIGLAVVIVFRTIWTFNKFEEIYLLTRGGPGTSTYNLALYAFDQSIANLRMGVGAAAGVIMLLLLLLGSVLYIRVSGFGREDKAA